MRHSGRVVTANLPANIVDHLDEVAKRIDRSRSWILRQAVSEWLAEEQRRYELTLEAMKSINEGQGISQEEVDAAVAARRDKRT